MTDWPNQAVERMAAGGLHLSYRTRWATAIAHFGRWAMTFVLQKFSYGAATLVASMMLAGCMCPSIGTNCPSIKGRIVDANTGAPISGATVALFASSRTNADRVCRSGRSGWYHLSGIHYFRWYIWGPEPHYSVGERYYVPELKISHPGYDRLEITDARKYEDTSRQYGRDGILHLRDALLKPESERPSAQPDAPPNAAPPHR